MTELAEIFAELGISHYLHDFIEQGFDTWDTILDITESDFDALGVKLGHRRKLQRKIANSRGVSSDRALASPRHTPNDERQIEEPKNGSAKIDGKDGSGVPHSAKRKYRRHPKPDENAPERPPSAYVIFSNKMREELKGRNLSFTEIAKLVGENWQNLSPSEKEPYEQQAFSAKERYNNELAEYKKTNGYREYSQYLVEFKARQANQQQVPDLDVIKRPRLEAHASTASSGTASSGASQHGGDASTGRTRVESSTSNTGQWPSNDSHASQIATGVNLAAIHGISQGQRSPSAMSPTVLPGYRESIFGGAQQTLHWRDGSRDDPCTPVPAQKLPRLASVYDRRSSHTESAVVSDSLNLTGSLQHAHRTGQNQSHPPPLLTSESTNRSSASSASTGSSAYFTPHTPLEPLLDRALPLPSLFPPKSSGSSDNQLAPFHAPSLSPQSTMLGLQQSPNSVPSLVDFPSSMAPMHGFTTATSQNITLAERPDPRTREYSSQSLADDNNLDPVSALLKAGEIVNRNSRSQNTARF